VGIDGGLSAASRFWKGLFGRPRGLGGSGGVQSRSAPMARVMGGFQDGRSTVIRPTGMLLASAMIRRRPLFWIDFGKGCGRRWRSGAGRGGIASGGGRRRGDFLWLPPSECCRSRGYCSGLACGGYCSCGGLVERYGGLPRSVFPGVSTPSAPTTLWSPRDAPLRGASALPPKRKRGARFLESGDHLGERGWGSR